MQPGSVIDLTIEKPAAGGRMLARHDGQIVLVSGAIPGERVQARIERAGKGMAYADTVDVLESSADRRSQSVDWRCGGNVFAHIEYRRQPLLKGEIVQDAMARIGRLPLPPPPVVPSPETGYRMRARLHVQGSRVGFYREGTHEICDAGATGQLLPGTLGWIDGVQQLLRAADRPSLAGVEIAENIAGDQRACHLHLQPGADPRPFVALASGLTGLTAQRGDAADILHLAGTDVVGDVLHVRPGDPATALRLHRGVRAFFQSNRFLLEQFVRHVVAAVGSGPVVDLYAGVGLFGLAVAAAGAEQVMLVEGDPVSSVDLMGNAEPFGERVRVDRRSVERFLVSAARLNPATVIVDPPRTGLSRDALRGVISLKAPRLVYVSCDVATLARDTRALIDAGYGLNELTAFDLFPNTAHVESVAVFDLA